jgi:type II secretory pathway component PulF
MLAAGISIIDTVDSLLEDSKGNQKKILEVIKEDLTQGKRLYTALDKFPLIFDKATINIIKAAEEAGTLDVALKDIKETLRKEMEFSDKIKSALMYPMIIFVVFIGVLLIILTFVIPKISEVFLRLNAKLPLTTRLMIAVSKFLIKYPFQIALTLVISIIVFAYFYKKNKKYFFAFISSLPLISGLVKNIDLVRFSRNFSLLLNSGLPIISALELSEDVVLKPQIAQVINHAKNMILSGRRLSDGFREGSKAIPMIMIKIIEAGEKSGTLEKSMQDISEYLDYQVSKNLKTITTLIEPIILVVVGVFVGGMMLSILAPIYGLISQVSGR